jgi:hypothetical protein
MAIAAAVFEIVAMPFGAPFEREGGISVLLCAIFLIFGTVWYWAMMKKASKIDNFVEFLKLEKAASRWLFTTVQGVLLTGATFCLLQATYAGGLTGLLMAALSLIVTACCA